MLIVHNQLVTNKKTSWICYYHRHVRKKSRGLAHLSPLPHPNDCLNDRLMVKHDVVGGGVTSMGGCPGSPWQLFPATWKLRQLR